MYTSSERIFYVTKCCSLWAYTSRNTKFMMQQRTKNGLYQCFDDRSAIFSGMYEAWIIPKWMNSRHTFTKKGADKYITKRRIEAHNFVSAIKNERKFNFFGIYNTKWENTLKPTEVATDYWKYYSLTSWFLISSADRKQLTRNTLTYLTGTQIFE